MADDDGDTFFFLRGGWPSQEVPVDAPKLVSLSILRNFTKQLNKMSFDVFHELLKINARKLQRTQHKFRSNFNFHSKRLLRSA